MSSTHVDIVIMTDPGSAGRYFKSLNQHDGFNIQVTHDLGDTRLVLDNRDQRVDVLVVDNRLDAAPDTVSRLRQSYPRLIIILVDEDADFGMPGQADEFLTDPLNNDALARLIRRMMADRQTETLRSDSMPAVRHFAKALRDSPGLLGKFYTTVEMCKDLGYDYVAYYHQVEAEPLRLELKAQEGPKVITSIVPQDAQADDLMVWVMQNGKSRIAGPEETPNHPLVARGRLGIVACAPVTFNAMTYGVLVACNDRPGSITQENVLMLELIGAQLAAAISKEMRS